MSSPRIPNITTSEVPIQRFPQGISQTAVRRIPVEKVIIAVLEVVVSRKIGISFGEFFSKKPRIGSLKSEIPARIQEI